MAQKTKQGYWLDASGQPVPPKFVPALDKRRDKLVDKIHAEAAKVRAQLEKFDALARGLIQDHIEWCYESEGITPNESGNLTLTGFSGDKQVALKVAEYISMDERLEMAKQLIDACLNRWTEHADENIQVIIHDAFQVDKKGKVNVRRILGLRKLKISDDEWQRAMDLIGDAVTVVNRKAYIQIRERVGHGEWVTIRLDLAAI